MNVFLSALVNGAAISLPLTGLVWLALRFTPRASLNAATRYAVWWALLLLVVFLPALYIPHRAIQNAAQYHQATSGADPQAGIVIAPVADHAGQPTTFVRSPARASSPIFPIGVPNGRWPAVILAIWAMGALTMLTRLTVCWIVLERRKARALPPPGHLMGRVDHWMRQCHTTRTAALCVGSGAMAGPIATGPWRPSILFPAWMVDQFAVGEIDQIGLHEAAHLARRDDYALTLQRILEAVFFLHPAVRWITRQIDLEREIGCDDFVVQILGVPRLYATCLTRVAELAGGMRPALTAAPVTDERSHLTTRVDMLLDKTRHTGTRLLKLRLGAGLAGLIFLAGMAAELPVLFSPVLIIGAASARASDRNANSPAAGSPATGMNGVTHSVTSGTSAPATPAPAAAGYPLRQAPQPAVITPSVPANDEDLQLTLPSSPRFTTATMALVQDQPVLRGVGGPKWNSSAGSIDYHMVPLAALVQKAWPMPFYRFVWPAWMVDSRSGNVSGSYDVLATMPADTTPEQLQIMLQGLLVDNLKIQAHWESRNLNVFALKVASGGVKFQKSANPANPGSFFVRQSEDGWHVLPRGPMMPATAPSGTTMATFVAQVSSRLDNPMVDMTGLEGAYDIDLFVARDPAAPWPFQHITGPGPYTNSQRAQNQGWDQSVFFQALETQLGLTVEPATLPTRFLVIDSINPVPPAN